MNKNQTNTMYDNDEDFEWMGMGDSPKKNSVVAERRRIRDNEITKKLGEYLLKGYCMLGDTCPECNCILLRTTDDKLLCVGCNEIDMNNEKSENGELTTTANKKKEDKKRSKKQKTKKESNETRNSCDQLENKLKWAVDELAKSQNPARINEMCSVIVKLTETIKALKKHEQDEN
ncbi:hypothetical protein I4U23_013400 [Adineta vaga]|nr:hypothetical protein I4U23_013400 [Adineta vaga]